jgi:GNAT superfamily N-acetyltransferase
MDHTEIIDYTPELQPHFYALNKAWIEKGFVLEDVDIEVMSNPQKYILAGGGHILMAVHNGEVAGTCSLKKLDDTTFELTKMAVDEKFRGKKIGRLLGEAVIAKAKELGCRKLILYSNRAGSAVAIQLYFKLGFKEIPLTEKAYKRADIKMEMDL